MDLGAAPRPSQPIHETMEIDKEERKQCSFCCAARFAAYAGLASFVLTAPGSLVTLEKRMVTWPRRLDRLLFIPVPVTLASFTHQYMMSLALWSKNKKQIWEINWETTTLNVLLWIGIVGASTLFSRNVLVKYSRTYRLQQWEYSRVRRTVTNPYVPNLWGTLSQTLDYVHFLWFVNFYHFAWLGATFALDRAMNAHYAIFYRYFNYSKRCSPRWREWRELQLRKEVQKDAEDGQQYGYKRWGTLQSIDSFRIGESEKRFH